MLNLACGEGSVGDGGVDRFRLAVCAGAMASEVGTAYAAWIAAKPDKAGRLEEIAGQVLTAVQTSTEVADGFAAAGGGGVGLGKTLIPVTKGAPTSACTTNG